MIRLTPDVAATLGRSAEVAARRFDRLSALFALGASGKHIYSGSVPFAEVQRRRAANKVARVSRRINRSR